MSSENMFVSGSTAFLAIDHPLSLYAESAEKFKVDANDKQLYETVMKYVQHAKDTLQGLHCQKEVLNNSFAIDLNKPETLVHVCALRRGMDEVRANKDALRHGNPWDVSRRPFAYVGMLAYLLNNPVLIETLLLIEADKFCLITEENDTVWGKRARFEHLKTQALAGKAIVEEELMGSNFWGLVLRQLRDDKLKEYEKVFQNKRLLQKFAPQIFE